MRNTNSLRNENHELSFFGKLEHFWQKYKIHTMVTVFLAFLFGSLLHPVIHQKETVLSIAFINAFPNVENEVIIRDFERHLQLNSERQQVLLDSTYYIDNTSTSPYAENYSQMFSANANAGKFDVVLADTVNFDYFGNQGFFQDLTILLSEEELKKYQERLYYIDFPDDDSTQKIPIGIKINSSNKICKTSCYPNMDAYWGVMTGSEHINTALEYLKKILLKTTEFK